MAQTEQELFWQGEFGDAYAQRNRGAESEASNLAFFSKALSRTHGIGRVLELGANIGLNMMALGQLMPQARLSAVEINQQAAQELQSNLPQVELFQQSILDFDSTGMWDLVFTKGVLIHINPEKLALVYEHLYQRSSRYILLSEYYNPTPVEVSYRGHSGVLFKRDFAGEMLAKYPDLALLDYGFVYRNDPNFPQDDMNWFLLEKRG